MRKSLCGFFLAIIFIFSGCAQVVSRETVDGKATVVECTHTPGRVSVSMIDGKPYTFSVPAVYSVVLLYDDETYDINGSACYKKCLPYVGKDVDVTIEIITFDNDTSVKRIASINVDKEEEK